MSEIMELCSGNQLLRNPIDSIGKGNRWMGLCIAMARLVDLVAKFVRISTIEEINS